MSIWRYVNCATCKHNKSDLDKYPCNECGKHPYTQLNEPFHNWESKYTYEEMVVK